MMDSMKKSAAAAAAALAAGSPTTPQVTIAVQIRSFDDEKTRAAAQNAELSQDVTAVSLGASPPPALLCRLKDSQQWVEHPATQYKDGDVKHPLVAWDMFLWMLSAEGAQLPIPEGVLLPPVDEQQLAKELEMNLLRVVDKMKSDSLEEYHKAMEPLVCLFEVLVGFKILRRPWLRMFSEVTSFPGIRGRAAGLIPENEVCLPSRPSGVDPGTTGRSKPH